MPAIIPALNHSSFFHLIGDVIAEYDCFFAKKLNRKIYHNYSINFLPFKEVIDENRQNR